MQTQGQCTILIVDDSLNNHQGYRCDLNAESDQTYSILTAKSVEDALALCSALPLDNQCGKIGAIILKCHLSDRNGLELLAILKTQLGAACPPVVIMGEDNTAVAVQAIKAGAQDYLVADNLTSEQLRQAIKSAIANVKQSHSAQKLLCDSERRFRAIFDSMFQFIGLLTVDGILIEANQTALDFGGLTQADVIGRPFWEARWWTISPETQAQLKAAIAIAASGEFVRYQVEVLGAGDRIITIDFSIKPVRDESGQVILLIPEGRDITEQVRVAASNQKLQVALQQANQELEQRIAERTLELQLANAALAQREAILRSYYNNAPMLMGVVELTEDDILHIYDNPATCLFFGHEPGSTTGKLARELGVPPAIIQMWLTHYRESQVQGRPVKFEYVHDADQSHPQWLTVTVFPIDSAFFDCPRFCYIAEDITSRKQTEEALQQTEAQMQRQLAEIESIYQSAPIGLSVIDTDLHFVRINQRLAEINGFSVEEHIGRTVRELLPHLVDEAEPMLRRVLAGEPLLNVELTGETPAQPGVQRTWLEQFLPIKNGNQIIGINTVCLEITEAKQREAALQESEERYRLLVDLCPDGIFIQSEDKFAFVNRAVLKLLGAGTQEELLGKPILDFVCLEYQEIVKTRIQQLREGQTVSLVEEKWWRLDGTIIDVEVVASPFLYHGQPAAQVVIRDISNRKQREADLQAALQKLSFHVENSPLAVIEWDQDWRMSRWSKSAEHIFGWEAEEVLGKRFDEWPLIYEADAERVASVVRRLAENREPRVMIQNRNYTKAGKVIDCEWYDSALVDESGNLVSVLSLVLDVSDRVQLLAERDRVLQHELAAREQAETANRIKDEFLAVLSHELRTPLNPILGWAKLLKMGKLSPAKITEAVNIIERNAKLQVNLIEDLLDVSRIMRGKLMLNVSCVNLATTISAAIETVRLAAQTKGIQIQTLIEAHLSPVAGDAARLQQIVWNLLSNAIKFTPNGGQVEVRLERVDIYAQITVSDTGKGINPEFLPYIFDYFRQEDSTITRKFGGLGLGLAIVRNLAELHGGTVEVDSPGIGLGSTFTVKLPLLNVDGETPFDNSLKDVSLDLSGIKVLVVDDDADSLNFVNFVLEMYDAKVTTVSSADQALQVLPQSKPDVLVSDIGMSQMDGYELLRQIRTKAPENGGEIPAIALTAYAGEFDQKQALAAGFQIHIPKPVEPEVLARAIARLAERRGE